MRVFDESAPSVVSIVNYTTVGGVRVAEGVGTGVVWDRLGHVATNYHVISKVDKSTISEVRQGQAGCIVTRLPYRLNLQLVNALLADLAIHCARSLLKKRSTGHQGHRVRPRGS
jgi:hypothetical protein